MVLTTGFPGDVFLPGWTRLSVDRRSDMLFLSASSINYLGTTVPEPQSTKKKRALGQPLFGACTRSQPVADLKIFSHSCTILRSGPQRYPSTRCWAGEGSSNDRWDDRKIYRTSLHRNNFPWCGLMVPAPGRPV